MLMNENNCDHDWEVKRNLVSLRVMKGIVNAYIAILYITSSLSLSHIVSLSLCSTLNGRENKSPNLILVIVLKPIWAYTSGLLDNIGHLVDFEKSESCETNSRNNQNRTIAKKCSQIRYRQTTKNPSHY